QRRHHHHNHGRSRSSQEGRQGQEARSQAPAPTFRCHDRRSHQGPEGAWWFLPPGHLKVHPGQQQDCQCREGKGQRQARHQEDVGRQEAGPSQGILQSGN
ncbi:unnamed protein product, partial [Meganyctiphanes norvegica]